MSNDLISRSALLDSLRGNVLVDVTPHLEEAIDEQPAAYDVDKVAERIKSSSTDEDGIVCYVDKKPVITKESAIEIVKSGGIE